jgi:hypothetical protein
VSSLNIRTEPWAAFPSADTTVAQLAPAILEFNLEVDVTTDLDVYLKRRDGDNSPPPNMEELGASMFGEGHNAILVTESGIRKAPTVEELEDLYDEEAAERNAEPA